MAARRHSPGAAAAPTAAPAVGFISLGCPKNLVDSQLMAGNLLAAGLVLAPSPEAADVVIVNTCAFIESAREESIDEILAACRLKQRGRCRAVAVTGCLPQRYRRSLADALPEVDAFIGLDELDDVGPVVRRLAAGERQILRISPSSKRLFEPAAPGLAFTGAPHAYLKIAEGCNHPCTFCAIPGIRGRHRSRPLPALLAEARALLKAGHRELDLISQDVTFYGRDHRGGPRLPELLRALGRLRGRFWIRLLYGYPSGLSDELLAAMAAVPKVCPYLDVPIQHSHPDMLRAMRRADTIRPLARLAERVRERLPGVVLRTTCLVGFPGETEAHFQHLLDFVARVRFDHLGVFTYSPEEGTPAASLPRRPSRAVAARRRDRLMLAQQAIVRELAAPLVGRRALVLLERPAGPRDRTTWSGRTARQAPDIDGVTIVSGVPATRGAGDFVNAVYTAGAGYDMKARCLD